LADAGFDVWLGNWRGTAYAREHTTLDTDGPEYWRHSLDELGKYDVADTVKYVHELTGQKVITMGEGYGGLCVILGLVSRPEINDMIKLNVGLSPIATMNSSFSFSIMPILNLNLTDIVELFRSYNWWKFGFRDQSFLRYVVVRFLEAFPRSLVVGGLTVWGKYGTGNFNLTRMPILATHLLTELSTTMALHLTQGINTGEVRRFDWGKEENIRRHGTPNAELYNMKSITSKYLYLQTFNDAVKEQLDAAELRAHLPDHDHYMVPDKNWHHMSYMFSINGREAVYDYLIDYIRKLERGETGHKEL
jgi:hypothetical protein